MYSALTMTKTPTDPKGARPTCKECGYAPFDLEFHLACHDFLNNHDQEKYEQVDREYRARMIALESW